MLICTALAAPSWALAEGTVEVMSWGGVTAIGVSMTDMGNPATPVQARRNMTNALPFDNEFWVDHMSQLNERFAAWLAS